MIKKYNYETAAQTRTFNTYEDVHCFLSADLHDYIKYLKFGYSKVYDHASREIRLKRFSRDYAIKMIKKYSNKVPKRVKLFCSWLGISEFQFKKSIEKFRNKSIWKKKTTLLQKFYLIKNNKDKYSKFVSFKTKGKKTYILNQPNLWDKENKFILMGRGYIDKYNYGAILDNKKK